MRSGRAGFLGPGCSPFPELIAQAVTLAWQGLDLSFLICFQGYDWEAVLRMMCLAQSKSTDCCCC